MNEPITLSLPPVGVKILPGTTGGFETVKHYSGISYCRALFEATFGQELLVSPGSLHVCQWAPVVLGLKEASNTFERTVSPHLEAPVAGLYLAPLFFFRKDIPPDVVVMRTGPAEYEKIIRLLPRESLLEYSLFSRDATALPALLKEQTGGPSLKMIRTVNRALHGLNRFRVWHSLTTRIFRSTLATRIFDRFITRYMANMSLCRNSTVIPFLTGRVNISHFCTGGIAWGHNDPHHLTSGFPWETYRRFESQLDYPGRTEDDPRLLELLSRKGEMLRAGGSSGGCQIQARNAAS